MPDGDVARAASEPVLGYVSVVIDIPARALVRALRPHAVPSGAGWVGCRVGATVLVAVWAPR